MSLAKLISGAKPLYGTPPVQTGGAVPGERPHGLAGFIDRVFNPTNALGQFSQALFAAGGNPGDAMAYMMQARNKGQRVMQVGDTIGVVDERTGQFTPTYTAPKQPDAFDQELADNGILPGTPEYAKAHAQALTNKLDPIISGSTEAGPFWVPRSQMNLIPGAIGIGAQAPSAAPAGTPDLPPGYTIRTGGAGGNTSGKFRGF